MSHFQKKVDRRSKESMVQFLNGHFRYNTMNSWNGSTSYAQCIKLHNLGLTAEQLDKAYDVIQTDIWDELEVHIQDFVSQMHGAYTIGTNGRSSGYLVLYSSEWKSTGYKSYCRTCYQRNYQACGNTEGDNTCGACRATGDQGRENYATPPRQLGVSSAGIDDELDFEDWSMEQLKARVNVIEAFDSACDDIRQAFIDMLEMNVVEETIMVPQKRCVLQASHAQ
ncbi:hypothetical protein EAH72_33075 [Pseudomonas caspiana]|nr:hypothetical protein [Pseudomonas caspiana]TPG88553.1 hypothetical protein EAH72_33075 [Pseudomonas caspiana]